MLNDGFGLPFFNQSPSTTQRQDIKIKPLSTEEEKGLLPRIGGAALGGLAYVGSSLEKALGGRAIRGALGGKNRELLSLIPFSDAMGITDYADRVSGRDLNKQWGLDDGGDGWGNFLGGLATEILTDPSMYATFGTNALTSAGKAVQKAGLLPTGQRARMGTSIDEMLKGMDPAARMTATENLTNAFGGAAGGAAELAKNSQAPLAGLFGWRPLPFMSPVPVFQGQTGIGVLDGVGKIGAGLKGLHNAIEATPVLKQAYHLSGLPFFGGLAAKGADAGYRYGNALLNNNVLGATTHEGQAVASRVSGMLPGLKATDRSQTLGWGLQLEKEGVKDGAQLRRWLEGVEKPPPQLQGLVDEMQAANATDLLIQKQMGLHTEQLRDTIKVNVPGPNGTTVVEEMVLPTQHWPRQWTHPQTMPSAGAGRYPVRPIDAGLSARREPAVSGFLGGTEGYNKAALDPFIHNPATTELAAAQHLISQGYVPANAEISGLVEKVRQIRGIDPNFKAGTAAGQPLSPFGNNPLTDRSIYTDRQATLRARAQAAYELMTEQAVNPTMAGAAVPGKSVGLLQALNKAGLTDDAAGVGASSQMLERLSKRFGSPVAANDLGKFVVDQKYADELLRYLSPFGTPEYINPLMQGFDKITNMFKTLVTTPFPGFHARNFLSGGFQNAQVAGLDALRNTGQGYKFIGGEVIPWANKIPGLEGLGAKEATDILRREMAAFNVGGHLQGQANEVLGALGAPVRTGSSLDDFLSVLPGREPQTLGDAAKTYVGGGSLAGVPLKDKINPLQTQGVAAAEDLFAPVAGGRIAGNVVEGTNRSALYMTLRKQGYSAEQAAKEVIGAHFDYSGAGLTGFEKAWMRRLVPFWSFARFNAPFVANQLTTNAGGIAGTYAKGALDARQDQSQFLPPFLGSGLAVPLSPEDPKGNQRFMTRFDMPTEQFSDVFFKPGGIQGTMEGVLSQLNPMLKGPLEYATGKQFFTGRDLEDLNTLSGNTMADQMLMNSPIARAVTTVRTLADEKKWQDPWTLPLNLLTGLKVTDVDLPKYRAIAEREYIEKMLRGQPNIGKFETLAIHPEAIGTMTNEQLEVARLQKLLEERGRQEAVKKRQIRIQ